MFFCPFFLCLYLEVCKYSTFCYGVKFEFCKLLRNCFELKLVLAHFVYKCFLKVGAVSQQIFHEYVLLLHCLKDI